MKKGITLVEILISMTIIVIIMLVVTSVYGTASQNFLHEGAKSIAQREINRTADLIAKQIKESASAPETYDTFTRDTNPDDVLLLGVPARDNDNNFLYSANTLLLDNFVYYLSNGELKRKIYAEPQGSLSSGEKVILSNVTKFDCTENNTPDFFKITCDIELTRTISGRTIKASAQTVSNLRNE